MDFNFWYTNGETVTEQEDIEKCLQNICSIPAGSIPLSRGLGLDWANLASVPPDLENDYATELIEKIETYEPRVKVSEVSFSYDNEGVATAKITLEKGDEEDVSE